MVHKNPNQNCQMFNGYDECLHQAAPRRIFGIAKCVLCYPSSDPRVIYGCNLQVKNTRPPAPGVPYIPQPQPETRK